jgi:hypothetical protein
MGGYNPTVESVYVEDFLTHITQTSVSSHSFNSNYSFDVTGGVGIAIDRINKFVYWSATTNPPGSDQQFLDIFRATITGSEATSIYRWISEPAERTGKLVFDHKRRCIYLVCEFGTIVKVDIDIESIDNGTVVGAFDPRYITEETFVTPMQSVGIEIDVEQNVLYLCGSASYTTGDLISRVCRVDLDTNVVTQIASFTKGADAIALDPVRDRLYVPQSDVDPNSTSVRVFRTNGTGLETVNVPRLGTHRNCVHDPTTDSIIFCGGNRVVRYDIHKRTSTIIIQESLSTSIRDVSRHAINTNYISKLVYRMNDPQNDRGVGFSDRRMYVVVNVEKIVRGKGYFDILDGTGKVQRQGRIGKGRTIIRIEPPSTSDRLIVKLSVMPDIGQIGNIFINSIEMFFDTEPRIPGCHDNSTIISSNVYSGGYPYAGTPIWSFITFRITVAENAMRLNGVHAGIAPESEHDRVFTVGNNKIGSYPISTTLNDAFDIADIGNGTDISLHREHLHIYWCEMSDSSRHAVGYRNGIYRCDIDGSNFTEILPLTPGTRPFGIEVDANAGYIYYSSDKRNEIRRCDLDGSNDTLIVSTSMPPKKFYLDYQTNEVVYVASEDILVSGDIEMRGGAFKCPMVGGTEEILVTTDTNPIMKSSLSISRKPRTRELPSGGISNSISYYIVGTKRDDAVVVTIQNGGPGINAKFRFRVNPLMYTANVHSNAKMYFYSPIDGSISATDSIFWKSFDIDSELFFSEFGGIDQVINSITESVDWITVDDIIVTKVGSDVPYLTWDIEFVGALAETPIQQIDVIFGNNLLHTTGGTDLWVGERSILKINVSLDENAPWRATTLGMSDYKYAEIADIFWDGREHNHYISGDFSVNGYIINYPKPRTSSLIPTAYGIDVGGAKEIVPLMFRSQWIRRPIGTPVGITIKVKAINNCKLIAQSLAYNLPKDFPDRRLSIIAEQIELKVGVNHFNFLSVDGARGTSNDRSAVHFKLTTTNESVGSSYADIEEIVLCELDCSFSNNKRISRTDKLINDATFDVDRSGWTGGVLITENSSLANFDNDGTNFERDYPTQNIRYRFNATPLSKVYLVVKTGNVTKYENDPGPVVKDYVQIDFYRVAHTGNIKIGFQEVSIEPNCEYILDSFPVDIPAHEHNGDTIPILIDFLLPRSGSYIMDRGQFLPSDRNSASGTEYTYRRKFEIDQISLYEISSLGGDSDGGGGDGGGGDGGGGDGTVIVSKKHTTNVVTFKPEYTIVSHTSSTRYLQIGARHSTSSQIFDPGYVLVSGQITIPQYYVLGQAEVERILDTIDPTCLNSRKLGSHDWHTLKKPNNCKN